ncbi:MAG: beta-propeller fold lactonase family protein [Candidatus Binataceae bacterium]|jgi:6-phosphogluconolactonase (cycloisomerase 2 family)
MFLIAAMVFPTHSRRLRGFHAPLLSLSLLVTACWSLWSGVLSAAAAGFPLRRAYIANFESGDISFFQIAADGQLVSLPLEPIDAGQDSNPLADTMTPDGRYLYVTNFTNASVLAFATSPSGTLKPLGSFAPPDSPGLTQASGIAITPDGKSLYVTYYNNARGGAVAGFRIESSGKLIPLGPAIASGGEGSAGDAIALDGRHLYAANSVSGTVSVFAIADDGSLQPIGNPAPSGGGTFVLAISPDGAHLYAANSADDTITAFDLLAGGGLTSIGNPVPSGGPGPRGILVSPDGQWLFAAHYNTGHNGSAPGSVAAFHINQDGSLALAAALSSGGNGAEALALSPNGADLYVANFGTSDVASFHVCSESEDCILMPLGDPVPTGGEFPDFQSIAIVPNQGPVAAFSFPLQRSLSVTFDGSSSQDPDGQVARFDWNFGDGASFANGGPSPVHTYLKPGNYKVSLVVTDNEGCSASLGFTGQSITCNGSAAARTSHLVPVRSLF